MAYSAEGLIGANVEAFHSDQQYKLGVIICGSNGAEYQYVYTSGTINPYRLCTITDDDTYTIGQATTTTVGAIPFDLCIPQITFSGAGYLWAVIKGPLTVYAAASCVHDVTVQTTATAGQVDDASTTAVNGLHLLTTVGGGAANTTAYASRRMTCN